MTSTDDNTAADARDAEDFMFRLHRLWCIGRGFPAPPPPSYHAGASLDEAQPEPDYLAEVRQLVEEAEREAGFTPHPNASLAQRTAWAIYGGEHE
jgi:hypothetical protein